MNPTAVNPSTGFVQQDARDFLPDLTVLLRQSKRNRSVSGQRIVRPTDPVIAARMINVIARSFSQGNCLQAL